MKLRVKNQTLILKLLVCNDCGTKREILRRSSKNKKIGHSKHMFCIKCQKKTEHIEQHEI